MTFSFSDLAQQFKAGTPISAADVIEARRLVWGDGGISPAEAETIFELNSLSEERPNEWVDFFVEALTEYIVNRQVPRGYVDEANAAWLMIHIDRDGKVETLAELELLVKIMDVATNVPESLKTYALKQIEAVVTTGEGVTRRGGTLRPGSIDEAEVALLRRLLFAGAGSGGLGISRDEAELLWRLKDATRDGDNAPEWQRLFVQVLGNHLMAHNSYKALDRGDAARLEAFVNDHRSSVGGFLGRMFKSLPEAPIREAFAQPARTDEDAAVAADRAITAEEAAWLRQHLDADGTLDELEKALLDFIAEESGTRI
jgi:hypothetical protein